MLVNLTPNWNEINRRKLIAQEHKFEFTPQCDESLLIETGIYRANLDFNFSYNEFLEFNIDEGVFDIPFEQSFELFRPTYHKSQYGVADSIEQIKEYFREEIADPVRRFFIDVTPVFQEKENRGKGGGWRWHKWGEYIGVLDSQCEYLDDEDFGEDFKYVIVFHIYELK